MTEDNNLSEQPITEGNSHSTKWTKLRKMQYFSNSLLIASIIVFITILAHWGNYFIGGYTYMADYIGNLYLPDDMEEFNLNVAAEIIKDNYDHTYQDYFEAAFEEVYNKNSILDSYTLSHNMYVTVRDSNVIGPNRNPDFRTSIEIDFNGTIGKGTISAYHQPDNAFDIPVYVDKTNDTTILYMQINNDWVKCDIATNESIFNMSPMLVVDIFKDKTYSGAHLPEKNATAHFAIESAHATYGPYKYFLNEGCHEGSLYKTTLVTYDTGYVYSMVKEGLNNPLDYSGLVKFATENNDQVLTNILTNYNTLDGCISTRFDNHNEIAPITIPDEVFEALYITDEQKSTLMQEIIDFFAAEFAAQKGSNL